MIWRRYPNELIVALSFLLMLLAVIYKSSAVNNLGVVSSETKASVVQIGEVIALKKQWGDEGLEQKVDKIKQVVPSSNIKLFSTKGKKLNASFVGLSATQVNTIVLKLQNIAVQIIGLDIKRQNESYSLEIRCKW